MSDHGVPAVPDHVEHLRAELAVAELRAKFEADLTTKVECEGVVPRPETAVRRTRANSLLPSRHKIHRDELEQKQAELEARLDELNDGKIHRQQEVRSARAGSVLEEAKLADAVEMVHAQLEAFRRQTSQSPATPVTDRIRSGVPTGRRRSISSLVRVRIQYLQELSAYL